MTTGMNAVAVLYLISGLYEQIMELQEQNQVLRRALENVSTSGQEHEQGKAS